MPRAPCNPALLSRKIYRLRGMHGTLPKLLAKSAENAATPLWGEPPKKNENVA